MKRMDVDATDFINQTDCYLYRKNKDSFTVDMEKRIMDYLCGKNVYDYDTPPVPYYFFMTELPQEYGPFEEFELTEENIYELLTTVKFQDYCELFYDGDNPEQKNWVDSWGIQCCYNDLVRFANSGANLSKRVYKGGNVEGHGILYCFRRDFGCADYAVYFNEVQ